MNPDPYATHVPVLQYFLARTTRPTLELGAGWYSTPLFLNHAGDNLDHHVTLESNKNWLNDIVSVYPHPAVQAADPQYAGNWPRPSKSLGPFWGLIFVDNGPTWKHRASSLQRLLEEDFEADSSWPDYLIVHDAESKHIRGICLRLAKKFGNAAEYMTAREDTPTTMVMSRFTILPRELPGRQLAEAPSSLHYQKAAVGFRKGEPSPA